MLSKLTQQLTESRESIALYAYLEKVTRATAEVGAEHAGIITSTLYTNKDTKVLTIMDHTADRLFNLNIRWYGAFKKHFMAEPLDIRVDDLTWDPKTDAANLVKLGKSKANKVLERWHALEAEWGATT